ncbi:MAG: hypothetical protein ACKO4Q_11465, partial [Planctomycetota bacterium]
MTPSLRIGMALGFAAASLLGLALYFGTRGDEGDASERRAREERAQAEAAPARAALEVAVADSGPYDVEATLRAVRELDLAVKQAGSVRDFLERVSRGDYRRVAPKVLATRKRILDVLVRYYGALDRQR